MRLRFLLLVAAVAVGACQKKPETILLTPPTEYQQKENPARRGLNEIEAPAVGVIAGQQFTPDNVVLEGRSLSFRKGKDIFPEMEIKFDVPAGKLEGKEWKFEGDKFENPMILASRKQAAPVFIWPKDYTMTLMITKESSSTIEGKILLNARDNTASLFGRFTATRKKTASDPLDASDAPYVHGKIAMVGPWKKESFSAGFVGKGADGKQYSNMAGTTLNSDSGGFATSATFDPQLTTVFGNDKGELSYRHTRVAPGEYLVYVKRNKVMAAWQTVTLKAGDQLAVALTIDPAKTGEVVVTLPDEEANDKSEWPVSLRPADLNVPGTEFTFAFNAADAKFGQKTVTIADVPAGKYQVSRGKSKGEVEVTAGKSTAVTLVRDEPVKK